MSRRILVVDDREDVRRALRRILERQECEVLTAAGGDDALRTLDRHGVDVVFLDLRLGDGTAGPIWYHLLLAKHPTLTGRIVAMSGALDEDASWIEAEGVPTLPKPFVMDDVSTLLRRLLPGETREGGVG